jgi:F0F1-type ATP synthase alpha subunit
VEEQVAIIFGADRGHLAHVDPIDVPRVNEELRRALREEASLLTEIREKKELSEDLEKRLDAFIAAFMKQHGYDRPAGEADVFVPVAEAEVEAEPAEAAA